MKKLDKFIEKAKKRNLKFYILICCFVIFFSLNVLLKPIFNIQIDLTKNASNTISQSTKDIISEIISPITIKLFYSPMLNDIDPIYDTAFDKTKNILIKYKDYASDKFNIEIYEIKKLSDLSKMAIDEGMKAIPLGDNINGFFGISMSDDLNNQKVISILNPYTLNDIEYDLTKLIYSLITFHKPIIGVMSDSPVLSKVNYTAEDGKTETLSWGFAELLQNFYEVIEVPPDVYNIPNTIKAMIVINPTTLNNYTAYALEQYLLRGGKMILMLDNYSKTAPAFFYSPYNTSNLKKLAETLGITLTKNKIISDLTTAHNVYIEEKYGSTLSSDIFWTDLTKSSFNKESNILLPLSTLSFHSASNLEISPSP